MRNLALWFVVLSLSLCGWSGGVAGESRVVLVTIDGFPARMFWDAKTPIPVIRQLAAEGAAAEGMRVSNPTVTWPNHTTLVTGVRAARHSVLYNGKLVRGGPGLPVRVEPGRDKSELVSVPTLYDVLHRAGLRTAAIDWPCTRNTDSLDDNFPDVPEGVRYTTALLRQELVSERVLRDEMDASFRKMTGPERDEAWTEAACHVIRARRPHLLLLHLLNTDSVNHRYGPQSPESYAALALADRCVGQLLKALEAADIRESTTVFLVADHGFATATKVLLPNALFRRAGLLEIDDSKRITAARAMVVPEGGTGMIYLTDPKTREADRRRVIELLAGKEGVSEVVGVDRYASLGLPSPEMNSGMADLVMAAGDGYALAGDATADEFVKPVTGGMNRGYHGYLASNPKMNAVFIASGRSIRRGVRLGLVDNIDVAPTMARLLGHELAGAEGKVISGILSSP